MTTENPSHPPFAASLCLKAESKYFLNKMQQEVAIKQVEFSL